MNIFDSLIIPESAGNLHLLNYILGLSLVLFLPYVGFITGASIYSLIFNILGRKKKTGYYLQFSREIIEMALFNKGILFTLGVVPLISILFSYAQLLHKAEVNIVSYFLFSIVLLVISFILIYTYKYTYKLDNLINNKLLTDIPTEETKRKVIDDTNEFLVSNIKVHRTSGWIGVLLLIISTYLIIGSIQLSSDTLNWTRSSFFGIIFSLKTLLKYLIFLTVSFSVTSGAVLLFFIKWRGNYEYGEVDYLNFVKRFCLTTAVIFSFLLPFLLLLNILFTPKLALSNSLFGLSLLSIILLFILIHFLYLMLKNSTVQYIPHSFYALLFVFILFVIGDTTSFATANQEQVVTLAANFDKIHQALMEKTGSVAARSGQDIYQGICSACHKFDVKLVGPAYKNILPKYEGKMDDLVSFILNPVKIDPAFPPMPNPGLKPNEAKTVAEYIMSTYKK